jgi:hypothetical protein
MRVSASRWGGDLRVMCRVRAITSSVGGTDENLRSYGDARAPGRGDRRARPISEEDIDHEQRGYPNTVFSGPNF